MKIESTTPPTNNISDDVRKGPSVRQSATVEVEHQAAHNYAYLDEWRLENFGGDTQYNGY